VKVVFTEPAEGDLEEIGDWIAQRNPVRAQTFIRELREASLHIGLRPHAYPFASHRQSEGIRRQVHGNYLIFYRIENDTVEILHVLHGAMDYATIIFSDDPN
jgi:toxin ParE1/3/4